METEMNENIVIVGAGIAGLTTALGLHRMGLPSVVLESSDSLRVSGTAFVTWSNAWKALDAIGIADSLRQKYDQLQGLEFSSTVSQLPITKMPFNSKGKHGDHEVRCIRRKELVETLEKELPRGTIRFSSKLVSIEEDGYFKLVHLADGSTIKAKVLIGCDGVNSIVAKWLGLQKPAFAARSSIRGFADFPNGHGFESKFLLFFGGGIRVGFVPCDNNSIYWFFTFTPYAKHKDEEEINPLKMKQFVMKKLEKVPKEVIDVIERTKLESIIGAPLKLRWPWNLLWGDIYKGNVCVAGDAFHPMTPDIGQGGCSALEDGVVLARCLAEALLRKENEGTKEKIEYNRIEEGLKKYAKERRWRSFKLITTAYLQGWIQQNDGKVMSFLRDNLLSAFMARILLKISDFDCGELIVS